MSANAWQHESMLRIAADHPCLPGHFPQQAVVPGVLILDRVVAAVRAVLVDADLVRLPQIKFVRPLLPEQQAHIRWQLLSEQEGELRVKFELSDAADVATLMASGELRFQRGEGSSNER